uniref:Uncharacterized protein n=1 Tax=Glossina pallidipes TaxID=7398 RepID=A0A1A9ZNV2_GLOPL
MDESMKESSYQSSYKSVYQKQMQRKHKLQANIKERSLRRGQKADPSKDQLVLGLVEKLDDIEYDNFVNVMNRLIARPFSYKREAFIDEQSRPLMSQSHPNISPSIHYQYSRCTVLFTL